MKPFAFALCALALGGGQLQAPSTASQPPATTAQRPATPQPPPDTEIYLAPLTGTAGTLSVGATVNITRNAGYDNQPYFTPDGDAILFTSMRGGEKQTDIYRYELASKQIAQVTRTPESEYSPTPTPDGGISVIRVEADGTQRLWRFAGDGTQPRVLLESVKPVGYHAWADDHLLALFVLGQPATLQLADARSGTSKVLASDIGRSLHRIPGTTRISFVRRSRADGQTTLTIEELDPATGSIAVLTRAVDGSADGDCAWTPDGTLLMAARDRLHAWRRGATTWAEVPGSDRLGLKTITRLAVGPKGTWIALVAGP